MPAPEFREDCRTLAEFHPDPEARGSIEYQWAHQFLPALLFRGKPPLQRMAEDPEIDWTRWLQAQWSARFLPVAEGRGAPKPEDPFYRVTDLICEQGRVADWGCLLITMPPPSRPPNAYFGAVLFRGDDTRYFTLERSDAADGADEPSRYLCGWDESQTHLNFGKTMATDAKAFLNAVVPLLVRGNGPEGTLGPLERD